MGKNIEQNRIAEPEIDIFKIMRQIWSKAWLVAIGLIVGAALLFFGTKYLITPQYEATSSVYIFSRITKDSVQIDQQFSSQLVDDFKIIATTRDTLESVIEELDLRYTYEDLSKKINAEIPETSHILKITVRDSDPQLAVDISNMLSDKLREQIVDIMNSDKLSVVHRAMLPDSPVSPDVTRNTAVGAFLGAFLTMAIIMLRYMMDDTVKSKEDVAKYLGLNTLAALPYDKGLNVARSDNKKSSIRN